MNFAVEILINLFCCSEKVFIHMNTWIVGKDETTLSDISVVDYRHAKRVFKNLSNENIGDYYDL